MGRIAGVRVEGCPESGTWVNCQPAQGTAEGGQGGVGWGRGQ